MKAVLRKLIARWRSLPICSVENENERRLVKVNAALRREIQRLNVQNNNLSVRCADLSRYNSALIAENLTLKFEVTRNDQHSHEHYNGAA